MLSDISDYVENIYDGGWSEFEWDAREDTRNPANSGVEIPGVGRAHIVESFGGEGQGEECWMVFRVGDRLFKKEGYYASYDGTTWDGDFYEVEAYEKVVTDYRKV